MKHTLVESLALHYERGDPLACYERWSAQPSGAERLLLVGFSLRAYWLADRPEIFLTALYLSRDDQLYISVTDAVLESEAALSPAGQYARWSQLHGFLRYRRGEPIGLAPTTIAKPWGREIWYTGVEERGVCAFTAGGLSTPIPWLQAVTPGELLGGEGLVLLKILDPLAEAVKGDLYFELHEEKQEVYVVTHIDPAAWPDGVGYIRMGFDPLRLQRYAGEPERFRTAYLEAVRRYETVRREIDALPAGTAPSPETRAKESGLRAQMESFSQLRPLETGDVVKVPLLTPHALQHGVRTVEFQTPVYERKILSFAQKVLTQDHWDTAEAVAKMRLDPVETEPFEVVAREEGLLVERIVDFSDFEVRRLRLTGQSGLSMAALATYALLMIISGELRLAEGAFGPEQALLLPRGWSGELQVAQPASSVVFLLALPRD